jgi:adenosylcobinamide kinase/adenosylcobinamide-phosphate guanylyltransferase
LIFTEGFFVPYIYVTGGASSGKSDYAVNYFRNRKDVTFIATGIATDPEMLERINAHRDRRPHDWETIDEPTDLIAAVKNASFKTGGILIDCLTFWTANLIFQRDMKEEDILKYAASTAEFLRSAGRPSLVITNELGMGIVPASQESRKFRKIAGEVNQIFAEKSEEAYLIVSGIPLRLK